MRTLSDECLRQIRNDIPVEDVIRSLAIPAKESEGYLRFLCPICADFHTATNPRTNLARCFRCKQNFNPIDLVMTVRKVSFLQAVQYLVRCFGAHLSG